MHVTKGKEHPDHTCKKDTLLRPDPKYTYLWIGNLGQYDNRYEYETQMTQLQKLQDRCIQLVSPHRSINTIYKEHRILTL